MIYKCRYCGKVLSLNNYYSAEFCCKACETVYRDSALSPKRMAMDYNLYCDHCGESIGDTVHLEGYLSDEKDLICKKCLNKEKIKIENEKIDNRFEILDL